MWQNEDMEEDIEKDVYNSLEGATEIDNLAREYFPSSDFMLAQASITEAFDYLPQGVEYSYYVSDEYDSSIFIREYTDNRGFTLYLMGEDIYTKQLLHLLQNESGEALVFYSDQPYTKDVPIDIARDFPSDDNIALESVAYEGPFDFLKKVKGSVQAKRASKLTPDTLAKIPGTLVKDLTVEQLVAVRLSQNKAIYLLYQEQKENVLHDKFRVSVEIQPTEEQSQSIKADTDKLTKAQSLFNLAKTAGLQSNISKYKANYKKLDSDKQQNIKEIIQDITLQVQAKAAEKMKLVTGPEGIAVGKLELKSYTNDKSVADNWEAPDNNSINKAAASLSKPPQHGKPNSDTGMQLHNLDLEYIRMSTENKKAHIKAHLPEVLQPYSTLIIAQLGSTNSPYSTKLYSELLQFADKNAKLTTVAQKNKLSEILNESSVAQAKKSNMTQTANFRKNTINIIMKLQNNESKEQQEKLNKLKNDELIQLSNKLIGIK